MLPAAHRLRDSGDFARTVRGARAAGPLLVVHARLTDPDRRTPARVGFVVSKAVGNAVRRNRTKRVLRELVRERLDTLQPGVDVVVRANPPAAGADRDSLGGALDATLTKSVAAAARRGVRT